MAEKKEPGLYLRGHTWWTQVRGVRESTGTAIKSQAKKILIERQSAAQSELYPILRKAKKITFAEFVKTIYIPKHVTGLRSAQFYLSVLRRLGDRFDPVNLDKINTDAAKEYIDKRQGDAAWDREGVRGISKTTINREITVLRNVLNVAVEQGFLPLSPLGRIKKFTEAQKERIFTDAELTRMFSAAREPLRSFILVAINTGMRKAEITGMLWSEVDLDRHQIVLDATRTKSQKGRTIKLNSTMMEWFAARKLEAAGSDYVFPNRTARGHGRPYQWTSHSWLNMLRRAGFDTAKPPLPRFHDLRHTWASRALDGNVPLLHVQHTLGHADLRTTSRYSHSHDEGLQFAVDQAQFNPKAPAEVVDLPAVAGKKQG